MSLPDVRAKTYKEGRKKYTDSLMDPSYDDLGYTPRSSIKIEKELALNSQGTMNQTPSLDTQQPIPLTFSEPIVPEPELDSNYASQMSKMLASFARTDPELGAKMRRLKTAQAISIMVDYDMKHKRPDKVKYDNLEKQIYQLPQDERIEARKFHASAMTNYARNQNTTANNSPIGDLLDKYIHDPSISTIVADQREREHNYTQMYNRKRAKAGGSFQAEEKARYYNENPSLWRSKVALLYKMKKVPNKNITPDEYFESNEYLIHVESNTR